MCAGPPDGEAGLLTFWKWSGSSQDGRAFSEGNGKLKIQAGAASLRGPPNSLPIKRAWHMDTFDTGAISPTHKFLMRDGGCGLRPFMQRALEAISGSLHDPDGEALAPVNEPFREVPCEG